MSTPMTAQAVVDALRAEGVAVQEYRDWRTHNRNHVGAWGPVHGVVIHHTVTSGDDSSVALCYDGHSDLPGPLCHGVGRNDGGIALVGHGRANHAGLGDDDVLNAVINETALPDDNEANTDGNRYFYGLEIVNLGNGIDTYPWIQYVAAVKWATAHCRAHGWTEKSVIGHKEWQPGKIDPKGPVSGYGEFDMNTFRADVRDALALPAGVWPEQEEDVAFTAEDKAYLDAKFAAIPEDVLTKDGIIDNPNPATAPDNPYISLETSARNVEIVGRRAGVNVQELEAAVASLHTKVDALVVGGVDLDALATAVVAKLAAELTD